MTQRKIPTAAKIGLAAAALGAAALYNRKQAREAESKYPPKGKFIELDGVRLHYVERGASGLPIVMLHGMGAVSDELLGSGLVDRAAERHRVLAFDRPGYGYSDRPGGTRWTAKGQAELIRAALAKLGIDRAIVLGHSWGTLTALSLALDHPELVAGLVLIAGPYFPVRNPQPLLMSGPALPGIGAVLANTTSPLLLRLTGPLALKQVFAPNPIPDTFKERFPHGLGLRPKQVRALAGDAGLLQASELSLSKRYRELTLPIALVAGDADKIVPFHHTERMQEAVPHARLFRAAGVGHMVHWVDLNLVMEAVDVVAGEINPLRGEGVG
jgi:pimeloyl-ACP methyl ester carboxylesterase